VEGAYAYEISKVLEDRGIEAHDTAGPAV